MDLETDAINAVRTPDAQLVLLIVVDFFQLNLCLSGEREARAIDSDLAVREAGAYLPFV